MAYSLSIQQILNIWAQEGVFSYLFPFLIIFAVVFAILQKTDLFAARDKDGKRAKNVDGLNAIIAVSIAFIALLNDYVPTFFAAIFPKFGIALSIGLIFLIFLGFFHGADDVEHKRNLAPKAIGWVLAVGALIWAWSEWNDMFGGGFEFNYFLEQYFWGIVLLVGLGGLAYWIVKSDSGDAPASPATGHS